MFYLEAHKFFKRKLVCILLIGIFLLIVIPEIGNGLYLMSHYGELKQRMDLFERHNGILTDETAEEFWEDYKGILSDKEVEQIYYDYEHHYFDDGELKRVKDTFHNISFDITFGYYEQWQMFLLNVTSYMQYIPVFIAVAFSGIFTYDKSCGMQEIMLSARYGRKQCTKAKVLLAFLVTNIMFLLVALISSIKMFLLTQGRGWNTSIQLSSWFRDSQVDTNYGILWLNTLFLSFLAINTILFITLSVSFLAKSPTVAMCISLGVLFLLRPDVVEVLVADREIAAKIVSLTPYNIINTYNLVRQTPVGTVQWIYIVEAAYVAILIAGGIFFFKKLIKQYKYFAS